MSKLPYMPLFTNDWLASAKVTLMTPAEEGAYIRLLCLAWNDDRCSLPTDDASLAAMSRLNSHWQESSAKIRACFEEHDGRLYNEKLLECWQESHTRRDKKSAGGVKGMLSRWHKKDSKPVITKLKDSYPVVNNIAITSTLPLPLPLSQATPKPEGTGDARGADAPKPPTPAKSFKTWTDAEFREQVELANADNLLTPAEVEDFIGYWQEKSASGRVKRAMERTWDTRRRMQTALRVVYENRRNSPNTTRGLIDWDKVRTEGKQ